MVKLSSLTNLFLNVVGEEIKRDDVLFKYLLLLIEFVGRLL